MATVAVSAAGATALVPTTQTWSMGVLPVAAIDESNTTVGIADSDLYFESPAAIDAALDQMQALGVNTLRIGIPWAGINPVPGYYDWSQSDYMINAADARGMGVLAVITTTPGWATSPDAPGVYGAPASPATFGEFAGLAAQRYAGKVGAYEIWNEPNAALYYGPQPDPAGYTQLLKAAYPTIKAADPNVVVIGGVVGSTITYQNLTLNPVTFVDQMYQNGAQGYFDALSFHPYQYTTPFSEGGYSPDGPISQLASIRGLMVANGDADKLVWASEYGEPSSVAGDAQQAAYLEDMLTTWRTLGYTGPAFVYTLQDTDSNSTDPEATLGLIRSDGTWKPAAYIVRDLATSPDTSPAMARMALAMPQAAQAEPADLATLAQLADTAPPATDPQPQTPVEPVMDTAASGLAAINEAAATSMAAMNQAAATSMAAINQAAATAMQRIAAMAPPAPEGEPTATTPARAQPVVQAPATTASPADIPKPQLDKPINLADEPTTSSDSVAQRKPVAATAPASTTAGPETAGTTAAGTAPASGTSDAAAAPGASAEKTTDK